MAKMSINRIWELLHLTMKELDALGGTAKPSALLDSVKPKANLRPVEIDPTGSSQTPRWITNVRFWSIECVKAGYLVKSNRQWLLTPDGQKAVKQGLVDFRRDVHEKYEAWSKNREGIPEMQEPSLVDVNPVITRGTTLALAREQASIDIESYISNIPPHEFEAIVAELLLAMDYTISFRARRSSADQGIDLIAHRNLIGEASRVLVQVKRYNDPIGPDPIKAFESRLKRPGDIGLFICSGDFTADALREARFSPRSIETINLEKLLELWREYYPKLSDTGKRLLPLEAVYFLGTSNDD